MYVLCTRRQMTVVYGPGEWMKFSTTRRLSTARDLSIRDGTTGWGVCDVGVNYTDPVTWFYFVRRGDISLHVAFAHGFWLQKWIHKVVCRVA